MYKSPMQGSSNGYNHFSAQLSGVNTCAKTKNKGLPDIVLQKRAQNFGPCKERANQYQGDNYGSTMSQKERRGQKYIKLIKYTNRVFFLHAPATLHLCC